MPFLNQLRHETVEKCHQQRADMRAVDIGIGHDDDLVIPQLRDIEIVSVAFGKTAAEGVDHRLDLRIRQHLVHRRLLDIQDLAADRQDRLIFPVSRRLGRTARGISLDDKDLALRRVPALAVRKLAVAVKGEFRLCEHVRLILQLCLPDLRGTFRIGDDVL